MKKAQWKETPRDRAFGVPRHSDIEKLQMQVADLMARLTQQVQKNEIWLDRVSQLKEQIDTQSKRLTALADIHRAYKFLRITGVVMEHEGEFKHLQGEDMDKFFGITQLPPEPPRGILRGHIEEQINAQFQKALQQYMLYGTSATQIFYDDKMDALTWLPPQKP